jgi:hypothetical protein
MFSVDAKSFTRLQLAIPNGIAELRDRSNTSIQICQAPISVVPRWHKPGRWVWPVVHIVVAALVYAVARVLPRVGVEKRATVHQLCKQLVARAKSIATG